MRSPSLLLLLLTFSFSPLAADEASELLASASLFGGGDRILARIEMKITESGEEKNRELELALDQSDAGNKSLARIMSPAFLSGMKFLKVSEKGKPDAQWLKTSKGIRRLGAANRSERVFGSHFTVEDFGSVDATGFSLALVPEMDDASARVVRAMPRGPAPYAERLIRIERGSGLIVGMEMLDAAGKTVKRYSILSFSGEGRERRPAELLMEDILLNGSTRLRILSLESPASIPERLFNPGAL